MNITIRNSFTSSPLTGFSNLANTPSDIRVAIAMMVEFVLPGNPLPLPGVVNSILFEDNTFENIVGAAFYVGSATNVTLRRFVHTRGGGHTHHQADCCDSRLTLLITQEQD